MSGSVVVDAAVALGSNLGDRRAHLDAAVDRLGELAQPHSLRVSSYHETAPVGGPPQGDFLNACAVLATRLDLDAFFVRLQEIERARGRERGVRNGPRTLDVDLLLFGDRVVRRADLVVPHPGMAARSFVLDPLFEIAPTMRHPLLALTVDELRARLHREVAAP